MLDYPRQKSHSTVGDFKVMWRTALKSERFRQERRWICQLRRHVRIRSHEISWRPDRLGAICLLKLLEAHLGRQKMQLKKAFQEKGKAK